MTMQGMRVAGNWHQWNSFISEIELYMSPDINLIRIDLFGIGGAGDIITKAS